MYKCTHSDPNHCFADPSKPCRPSSNCRHVGAGFHCGALITKIEKVLIINIASCHDCPCLKYYPESGCRVYVPAHYSCDYGKKPGESAKLIAEEGKRGFEWNGEIPTWCEIGNKPIQRDDWDRG